jgi:plastocyanin
MIQIDARIVAVALAATVLGAAVAVGFKLVPSSTVPLGSVAAAPPPPPLPPRTGVWPVNFTFHGNAGSGWGFSNATIRNPGPKITVYYGDTVNLTLLGTDPGVAHSWFVDYNNDSQVSPGEPSSPPFNGAGDPVVLVWDFTALQPGNWTYRCGMHPNSMAGAIQVLEQPRRVNLTLIGDSTKGWGFSNATIRNPGPPLVVLWGTNLTLTLLADYPTDSANHNWFIDYNNDLAMSQGEPGSPDFNTPVGKIIVWSLPPSEQQTGNWTYRCHVHPTTMTGIISIVGGPPPSLPRGTIPLITGIMVGALAFVLIFAVIYHARAVRASKRAR